MGNEKVASENARDGSARSSQNGDSRNATARPISPRRSTTRRFQAAPGTWNEERIVAALHEWAEEAGSPPRSWEWSPASARSAGLMGPEESKWEREHPRWPSNTTVYHYFESWPAALEAAGIKPVWPAGPEGTLAERVEAARRMHSAGETNRAIAEVLGVRPETVSRYLRAHPCRACASPVVGDKKLCHTCSTRRGNPMRWSREEVIAAVQRWIRMEGRAPTSRDWRPRRFGGAERWEEEFGEWPPSSVARLLFGGWGRMLEAAGTTPNKPTWTPDEILVALRSYAKEFGRPPAKQELEWPPAGYPSSRTVRRHFGSFTAGLRAAGLESRKREWTRERIVEAMREFELETDRWPRSSDWLVACEDWPSASTVHNRFGSWQAGLDAAMRGWTYPPRSG